MLQRKITVAETPKICLDRCHPIRATVPQLLSSLHFYAECPFCPIPPSASWLGQAPNNAGLHTRWLVFIVVFVDLGGE